MGGSKSSLRGGEVQRTGLAKLLDQYLAWNPGGCRASEDPSFQVVELPRASQMGASTAQDEMRPILDKRRENLHQVACLRLYDAVHPHGVSDNVGNHPNAFFNSSVEYTKSLEKKKAKEGTAQAATAEPVAVEEAVAAADVEMQ